MSVDAKNEVIDIEEKLLLEFKKLYEKQDLLSKIQTPAIFNNFGNSDIHVIDAIGNSELNGKQIADKLNFTRSAITKIAKRLMEKGLIISYRRESNKKEVFYKLTDYGRELDEIHKSAHKDWEERDSKFLRKFNDDDKEIVFKFLKDFNIYLDDLIEKI